MAISLHTQPQDLNLSGNPIKIKVITDTVAYSNHFIHVLMKTRAGNILNGKTLGEDVLPVINNAAEFDVADYCKKHINLDLNIFQLFKQDIQEADFISEIFSANIWETFNDGEFGTVAINGLSFYAIQGGFSSLLLKNYLDSNKNFYDNFLKQDKKFLTWAPEKKLTWNQHDFLFFTQTSGNNTLSCRAHFKLFYSDNTTEDIYTNYLDIEKNKFYFITTSLLAHNFLALETASKKINKYEIRVIDNLGNAQTETRTYYIDRTYYNHSRQFIFRNSLGGYDIIVLKGISEHIDEIQRTIGYFQTQDYNTFSEFTEKFKANSGFISTQFKNAIDAKKYVIDFINSREIYEIVGRNIVPVIAESKKVNIVKDNEFIYSFNFEYKYAYSDEYFAPIDEEQYFNPILIYRNGTITNAKQGDIATLTFEARINADATINFIADWGADIGISKTSAAMQDGVWQTIQMQMQIPDNAYPIQTLIITDDIGGRYIINYNIIIVATNILSNILIASSGTQIIPYDYIEGFAIDPATLTFTGDAIVTADPAITGRNDAILIQTTGKLSNISFSDTAGNQYLIPCTEGYSGADDGASWTLHEVKQGKRFFIDGLHDYRRDINDIHNFYNLAHGASKLNVGIGIIYVPYNESNQKIFNT